MEGLSDAEFEVLLDNALTNKSRLPWEEADEIIGELFRRYDLRKDGIELSEKLKELKMKANVLSAACSQRVAASPNPQGETIPKGSDPGDQEDSSEPELSEEQEDQSYSKDVQKNRSQSKVGKKRTKRRTKRSLKMKHPRKKNKKGKKRRRVSSSESSESSESSGETDSEDSSSESSTTSSEEESLSSSEESESSRSDSKSRKRRKKAKRNRKTKEDYSFVKALPKFDGEFHQWRSFKDLVFKLVIKRKGMSNSMKSSIVLKQLEGSAEKRWKYEMGRSKKVKKAWERMSKYYEDDDRVQVAIQQDIEKMKTVKSERDTEGLRALRDSVQQFQGMMSELGREYRAQARSFTIHIAHKLDRNNAMKMLTDCKDLKGAIRMLDKLIKKATTLNLFMKPGETSNFDNRRRESWSQSRATIAAVNDWRPAGEYMRCNLCDVKQEHYTSECPSIKGIENLIGKIKEKKLCYKCLCLGHLGKKCPNSARVVCRKCGRNHSSVMCGVNLSLHFAPRNTNFSNEASRGESFRVPREGMINKTENEAQATLVSNVEQRETEPSSRFWITVEFEGRPIDVLIDTGASVSLISESSIPKKDRYRVPAFVAHGFGHDMATRIEEATALLLNSPEGPIQVKAHVCKALRKGVLIIGRDQLKHVLKENHRYMKTVWGNYDFAEQAWQPPRKEICSNELAWYERWEEERVDRAEISMKIKRLESGRFEAELPFFTEDRPRQNYEEVERKLFRLKKSLERKQHFEEYDKQIGELIQANHAEEVLDFDGHFIYHRAVERPEASSTPFRVVLAPLELNCLLWKGEAVGLDVLTHLIRLRTFKWVLIADLKKAFLQIEMADKDRKYLRFLWFKEGRVIKYQMRVLPFGVVSAPSILTQVVEAIVDSLSETSKLIMKNSVYMDDILTGGDDQGPLLQAFGETKAALETSGFQVHKERSNLTVDTLGENSQEETKVLGLLWSPKEDNLRVVIPQLNAPNTRRELLSTIGKIFDPFGIYDPVKITLRALFAKVLAFRWDDPLPDEIREAALNQVILLQTCPSVSISRKLCVKDKLRAFGDASKPAFGYAFYMGDQFVFGRAKVFASGRSIVDGELQALYELFKALPKIVTLLGFKGKIQVFSDSSINLDRLYKSPNVFPPPEARRLFFILRLITQFDVSLYHIPGRINPADYFSRASRPDEVVNWVKLDLDAIEADKVDKPAMRILCPVRKESQAKGSEFCSWLRGQSLRRQFSLVCKLKAFIRRANPAKGDIRKSTLSNLVCLAQAGAHSIPKECRLIDGVYCYPTRRIDRSVMFVPKESKLAALLSEEAHVASMHRGSNMSLAMISSSVHIQNGTRIMKALIARCPVCRKERAKGIDQSYGPLHPNQTQPSKPFEDISMDCFGPMFLKNKKKVWGLLTICRTSRAVKLEPLEQMSGPILEGTLTAQWEKSGFPLRVRTDNGSNFLFVKNRLQLDPRMVDIDWKLATPLAPWMNGAAEKMIQVTKNCLDQFLGPARSYFEVTRRFATVESVINSRPILYMSERPYSAFALAYGRELVLDPRLVSSHDPRDLLKKRELQRFEMALAWKAQYVRSLSRYCLKKNTPIKIGDGFWIPDAMKRRIGWATGVVVDLKRGRDDVCRSVLLKMPDGSELWRPAQALIPLSIPPAEVAAERSDKL